MEHVAYIWVYVVLCRNLLKWWFSKAIYEFLVVAGPISQERLAFYNKWRSVRELGPGGRARGWEVRGFLVTLKMISLDLLTSRP